MEDKKLETKVENYEFDYKTKLLESTGYFVKKVPHSDGFGYWLEGTEISPAAKKEIREHLRKYPEQIDYCLTQAKEIIKEYGEELTREYLRPGLWLAFLTEDCGEIAEEKEGYEKALELYSRCEESSKAIKVIDKIKHKLSIDEIIGWYEKCGANKEAAELCEQKGDFVRAFHNYMNHDPYSPIKKSDGTYHGQEADRVIKKVKDYKLQAQAYFDAARGLNANKYIRKAAEIAEEAGDNELAKELHEKADMAYVIGANAFWNPWVMGEMLKKGTTIDIHGMLEKYKTMKDLTEALSGKKQ